MCKTCRHSAKRYAALLTLAPALTIGAPILSAAFSPFQTTRSSYLDKIGASLGDVVPAAYAAADNDTAAATKWTCPMHPHYIADEMGTCPICGMDLVKLQTGGDAMNAASAESRTVITVAPETVQNIGVRLAKAEQTSFGRSVRSYGIVRQNERLQTEITSRVEGWIEELKITAMGDEVEKDSLLFTLYSPQLVISQNDYLRPGSRDLEGRGIAQLKSLGVQDKALEQMRKDGKPTDHIPFYADRSGVVSELNLRAGTYVKRGMLLAKIQSYASVWLIVSVAEKDLAFLSKTTRALVHFPHLPDRQIQAQVDYIYPTIDAKTRTGQVRLVIDNPDGLIRPGSYADVVFETGVEQRVAVPSEAILKNGNGHHVVVSLGQGRFEPRAIQTGLASGQWTEVKNGVKSGEEIVVTGQFLLDSESALRETFRKLERLQLPLSLLKPDDGQFAMIDHLVDAALYLHEALIDGYDVDPKFLDAAISIRDLLWPRFKDTQLAFILDDSVAALRQAQTAQTLSETEAALAKLADVLRPWLLEGASDHYQTKKIALFKEKNGDRLWIQKAGRPLNPYGAGASEQIPWPTSQRPSTADAGSTDDAAKDERLASKEREKSNSATR